MIAWYYESVGCVLHPGNMECPVIMQFLEQWKALKEKKEAEAGLPPKLQKDKPVHKWLKIFGLYLSNNIGVLNAPLTYGSQTDEAVVAVMPPCAVGEPFSEVYGSIEEELSQRIAHTHTLFRSDNAAVFHIVDRATVGHNVLATVALLAV